MLLRKDKRCEVFAVEDYRGLTLFQVAGRAAHRVGACPEVAVSEGLETAQHAPKKGNSVRELVLK